MCTHIIKDVDAILRHVRITVERRLPENYTMLTIFLFTKNHNQDISVVNITSTHSFPTNLR